MNADKLIFQTTTEVKIASNTFINVPVILKFEDTNLIEIVKDLELGFTTQIPIFHADGTYLAKINGTRSYPTVAGRKAGIIVEKSHHLWICKMGTHTLFEIRQQPDDSFKIMAELYTPYGYFVKCNDSASDLIDLKGKALNIGGIMMSGNTFIGCSTGIWLRRDGSCTVGLMAK